MRIGINGFGRIGRLMARILSTMPEVTITHINDPAGDAATWAHLLEFDSVHGTWQTPVHSDGDSLLVDGQRVTVTANTAIADTNWGHCDVVVEASGQMRDAAKLQAFLAQGVQRVVVCAPVRDETVLNVVMGVNHDRFEPQQHRIVTAASCTTNCLAPVVRVIDQVFGIRHASFTTIHDLTNTQRILDGAHRDLRRARACGSNLIPTTTGSASAIIEIFPHLNGRIDGQAVRVPLANASLTDMVFEIERETDVDQVNQALDTAASGALKGILGFESRPLVSSDYRGEPRSAVIDALSTRVINATQVKLYAWYDNEWGYANRAAELARLVGQYPV